MTPERLDEIKARCDAATPGKWKDDGYEAVVIVKENYNHLICSDCKRGNRVFISHARQDVPELVAEVERLTAERDASRKWAAQWKRLAKLCAEQEPFTSSLARFSGAMLIADERDKLEAELNELAEQCERLKDEVERRVRERDEWMDSARRDKQTIDALEQDLINERGNCEIMTHRAEALERAARNDCHFCAHVIFDEIPNIIHCRLRDGKGCENDGSWQFDEARFAPEEAKENV